MKKLFFILSFLICAVVCFSQTYPVIQGIGGTTTLVKAKSALQVTTGFINARFTDTLTANADPYISHYAGSKIVVGNQEYLRNSTATAWLAIGGNGSLSSTVSIVDSNHIQICNVNGCDTITINGVNGPITNITILNDTTLQICGSDISGTENITNGGFSGSATGWTLGSLWAYGTNNVVHSFGSVAALSQTGTLTANGTYTVLLTIGGTQGSVAVALDGGTTQTYNAGAGASTFIGTWNNSAGKKINITPSNDFDGTITNVSVKQVLPNCDTLQIVPTNFQIDDTIFAASPLTASGNFDTLYSKQSGSALRGNDSGYLSTAGYDSFLNKVDSLTHFAANNLDILQSIKNGVTTNWDSLDIVCYGLGGNPPMVAWSGDTTAYAVTSGNYRINCKPYTSPPTTLILPTADPTNGYFATFYVDTSGNAGVLIGTPAASPIIPQVDQSYQILLTSILVPASSVIPPIDTAIIFDYSRAGEWTVTNTGTTTDTTNTVSVYRYPKSINVTNIRNTNKVIFTSGSPVTINPNYVAVVGFIKLKQVIPAAATLYLQWLNGTNVNGNVIPIQLNKSNIITYQAFSVPIIAFTLSSDIVTALRINYVSNNNTVNQGFYLDFIYLQNGVTPSVPATTTNIVAYNGLTHFKNNNIDSIKFGGKLTEATTVDVNGKVLAFKQDVDNYLTIDPTVGNEVINLRTFNESSGAQADNVINTGVDAAVFYVNLAAAGKTVAIYGDVEPGIATLTYTADTHTFTGDVILNSTASGATTDSVLVENPSTHVVGWRNASSFGNQTLQQVFNTQVGGSVLTKTDSIMAGSNFLRIIGTNLPLWVTSSGSNGAIEVEQTTANTALVVTSAGQGITSASTEAVATAMNASYASTNSIQSVAQFGRTTTGTAANGIGGTVDFALQTSTGATNSSNRLESKWTDATNSTRTSQFIITGVLSAASVNVLTLSGNSSIQLNPITATAASAITPAEGMIVFVSSTNGTFGTIGIYCYQNAAWHAL